MDVGYKVVSMLFVAKAVLRQVELGQKGYPLSGWPDYLPNNIRPTYDSYKVVSMLFIVKAELGYVELG